MSANTGQREIKSYRWWTQAEDEQLTTLWQTRSLNDCAAIIGRGTGSVYNRVQKLGLKRTDEYKAITGCGRFGTRKPWNAGLKGWQAGGRSKDTQFKLGNRPSNTWRPIGSERVSKDGILYRKVSDTGDKKQDWRAVHVLIWEAENGPLPDGWVVVFEDKDRQNFAPENLLALSKQDHMRRNSITRYPREVHAMAIKIGRFAGKLKKLEKENAKSE